MLKHKCNIYLVKHALYIYSLYPIINSNVHLLFKLQLEKDI
jgi:hypothetical protein